MGNRSSGIGQSEFAARGSDVPASISTAPNGVAARLPNRDFVRVGRSPIHGKGLYAKRKIPRGTRVIEYTGERIPLARLLVEVSAGSATEVYTFQLNPSTMIDGSRGGNEARLINHSCDPNCEAYVFDERVYVYALRDIVRGEELTFDYQLTPALKGRPQRGNKTAYLCCCGSPKCRGTLLSRRRYGKTD
jgi:SET domain-containing protein